MEDHFSSRSLLPSFRKRDNIEGQIERIKRASELAQEKIDYTIAHNESILHAVEIVEGFLRKKHRLCYGGQAINAYLPDKYKFYDPERTIPDYDFFSPQPDQDIRVLVQDLKKAGFQEISAREGMHEGTVKLYVDYIPVADITAMDPTLYRMLSKRETRVNGISYLDMNTLRMMMYLELSRPRGEVDRWPKVYERLMLLNMFGSKRRCHPDLKSHSLSKGAVELILQWIIQHRRIFAGIDLVQVYRQTLRSRHKKVEWLASTRKPILFYSSTPNEDMNKIREQLETLITPSTASTPSTVPYRIKTEARKSGADLLPEITILYQGTSPILFCIHQTACHSYFQLPLHTSTKHKEILRIASVDTLITLYFSLGLMDNKYLDMTSMECLANQLIQLGAEMRRRPKNSPFPFISLNCAGHQTTLTSLIRAKVERMTERKARLKNVLNTQRPLSYRRITVRAPKGSKASRTTKVL